MALKQPKIRMHGPRFCRMPIDEQVKLMAAQYYNGKIPHGVAKFYRADFFESATRQGLVAEELTFANFTKNKAR